MATQSDHSPVAQLEVFIGVWKMGSSLPGMEGLAAETRFEWLEGKQFLVQRWRVEHPDAPDGIAVVGFDVERSIYLQHYFDSRGVARIYEMTLADRVWTLSRMAPGFSQRFTGSFSAGGDSIEGRWESSDDGSHWEHDFDLTYAREPR